MRQKLATSERWATRAMRIIFEHQTADEQDAEVTSHSNGVGFNGSDAELLSSYAKQLEKRGFLTPNQLVYVFKKMPKYAGQVINNSDEAKLDAIIEREVA